MLRPFAPIGQYAGHWGIDFGTTTGTPVAAAGVGTVTFAGTVADRLSVTVDHGGDLKTSYSYLESVGTAVGVPVEVGTVVGTSGTDNELEAVHFSVRVDGVYVDPEPWLQCHPPGPAVWLTIEGLQPAPYAGTGATRHSRRHLRPASPGPPGRRRDSVSAARTRDRHPDPGRQPVAEGGARRQRSPPPHCHDRAQHPGHRLPGGR
ncbi:MAG: M23 family metallopeptidase [Acidimicrobiia bacterium]|nr:M23 family metallopeptidase [Acidimicrobiia bacterium]